MLSFFFLYVCVCVLFVFVYAAQLGDCDRGDGQRRETQLAEQRKDQQWTLVFSFCTFPQLRGTNVSVRRNPTASPSLS